MIKHTCGEMFLITLESLIGIPHYEIIDIENEARALRITARFIGTACCPECGGERLQQGTRGAYRASRQLVGQAGVSAPVRPSLALPGLR